MESLKTVAIIGAGPSGLVAAKNMLADGIRPTIFDKSPDIGGMWNPDCHPSWKSLKTNVSRFATCCSDFPWPDNSPLFPTQSEMHKYLKSYSSQFIPEESFQMQTTVTNVKRTSSGKSWLVHWTNSNGEHTESFDFLVVATGFFSTRQIPRIPLENFTGTIMHSEEYRSPEIFQSKRVLVIGSSFSSAEICAEVCNYAEEVINVVSTPFWVIPRFIPLNPDDPATPFLPVDLVLYMRTGRKSFEEMVFKSSDDYLASNQYFSKLCGHPIHEPLQFEPSAHSTAPGNVAISDDFLPAVRSGLIEIRPGRIKSASGSVAVLEDGSKIENVDTIIFCTGFRPTFPFLSPEILNAISFDCNDSFCPLLLHKATFCSTLPGIAFIGVYRGPYFLIAELQSIWAAKVFSKNKVIPFEEQVAGVLVEKRIRDQIPRPSFPHPDYVGFACSLAENIGNLPPHDLYGPHFVPADFCAENKTTIAQLKEERELCLAGKMVAGAVFRALAGSWAMRHEADGSTNELEVSYILNRKETDSYQYLQTRTRVGDLNNQNDGGSCVPTFMEGWRYDKLRDVLQMTAKSKKCEEYHSLRFLPPSASTVCENEVRDLPVQVPHGEGWKAISEFQCDDEIYKLYFLFQFAGVLLRNIHVITKLEVRNSNSNKVSASLTSLLPKAKGPNYSAE